MAIHVVHMLNERQDNSIFVWLIWFAFRSETRNYGATKFSMKHKTNKWGYCIDSMLLSAVDLRYWLRFMVGFQCSTVVAAGYIISVCGRQCKLWCLAVFISDVNYRWSQEWRSLEKSQSAYCVFIVIFVAICKGRRKASKKKITIVYNQHWLRWRQRWGQCSMAPPLNGYNFHLHQVNTSKQPINALGSTLKNACYSILGIFNVVSYWTRSIFHFIVIASHRCRLRHPRRHHRGRRRRPRIQDQYNDHKVFRLNFNVLRVLVKCNEYSCSSYRCVALRMQWKEQNKQEIALQVASSHSLWNRAAEGFKSSVQIQTPTFWKSEKHRMDGVHIAASPKNT